MENIRHSAWNHRAIKDAVETVDPAVATSVSDSWRSIGHDFETAVFEFRATVDSAVSAGWHGEAATSTNAAVARYSTMAASVGAEFTGVGSAFGHAAEGADSIRPAVPAPIERPEGWTRAMPWTWGMDEAADEAEQSAKSAMESTYQPALDQAAAAVSAAGSPTLAGFDKGPDGIHGVPIPGTGNGSEAISGGTDSRVEAVVSDRTTPGGAMAAGALAGALGSGAAQYARQVVANHGAAAMEAANAASIAPETEDTEIDVEPPTYLVEMDQGSEVVGSLPPASPSVIGR